MSAAAIIILVEPARKPRGQPRPGVYTAMLEGEAAPLATSTTPFLDAARALRGRGYPDDVLLIMRWRGRSVDSLRARLADAAAVGVEERSGFPSLRLVKYRRFDKARLSLGAPASPTPLTQKVSAR
jgi:hypothetical protein